VPEGKAVKNRLHLDLKVSGGRSQPLATRKARVELKVAELVAAGATVFRVGDRPDQDHYSVVMQDLEGNEFCVAWAHSSRVPGSNRAGRPYEEPRCSSSASVA
jgi:hypothetical protein